MPVIISYNSYDASWMLPVSVIASYNVTGSILPLYVGHKGKSYKVLSAALKKSGALDLFDCKIDIHGRARNVTLTYHRALNLWTVPRITN